MTTRIVMTYELAMAASKDAANRQMRREGRTKWNEADWDLACAEFERLLSSGSVCLTPIHRCE